MAVISRSIPAVPYQGGTMQTQQPYSCAVQLNSTRMVWTYCQTNPNWRFFVIVDTPDGWANGGTPSVTVARMQDQHQYAGLALHMVRLNDNAFMINDLNVGGTTWQTEIFEIDSNNQFNRTYQNLNSSSPYATIASTAISTVAAAQYGLKNTCLLTYIPVKDNVVYEIGINNGGTVQGRLLTYDNTQTTMLNRLTPTYVTNYGSVTYFTSSEVRWRTIPGSSKFSVSWHGTNVPTTSTVQGYNVTGSSSTGSTSQTVGTAMIDFTGYLASSTTAPVVTGTVSPAVLNIYVGTTGNTVTGNNVPYDVLHMSETRTVRLNWQNAYFFDASTPNNSTASAQPTQGGAEFNSTASANPLMAWALDANYLMLMDRTNFVTTGGTSVNIKIIRREDSNFVTMSPGSSAGTGFSVTVPWVDIWRAHQRPRMQTNGDLFWWGLDSSGNLTWNIIKNAVASS